MATKYFIKGRNRKKTKEYIKFVDANNNIQVIEKHKRKENKNKTQDNFYVNKSELYNLIVNYNRNNRKELSDSICNSLYNIAKNVANIAYFRYNLENGELIDAINSCYLFCISKIKNYDAKYKNPFAFFTSICYNYYLQYIKKYSRYRTIRLFSEIEEEIYIEENNNNLNNYI